MGLLLKHAQALKERAHILHLGAQLRPIRIPGVHISKLHRPSIWLHDLVQLGDLRKLPDPDGTIVPCATAPALSSGVQFGDFNGKSFEHIQQIGKLLGDLIHQSTCQRQIDIRTITGLERGMGVGLHFTSIEAYALHPFCHMAEAHHALSFEECIANAFGNAPSLEFQIPAWSAALHDDEPRVYWRNAGDAHFFALAKVKAIQKDRVYRVRGDVESLHIRATVLLKLLSAASLVMVDSQQAHQIGLYDLLRTADFPALMLRGLDPFSRKSNSDEKSCHDILIFPRSNPLAGACADMLLRSNPGADFGAFLIRLSRSQPNHFLLGH